MPRAAGEQVISDVPPPAPPRAPSPRRVLELAGGLTGATLATAERIVARLVKDGDVAADRAEQLLQDLLGTAARSRDDLVVLIRAEIARAVEVLDLATRDDLDELERRLADEDPR